MTTKVEPGSAVSGPSCDAVIQPDEIRCQLERILVSRTFKTAEGQQAFLRYAVGEVLAGRGSLLKEYLIGVEAFGRGDQFDPRLDPIVRTQARKLRARLAKYYAIEGVTDPIQVAFPKGSYVPAFVRTTLLSAAQAEEVAPETPELAPLATMAAASRVSSFRRLPKLIIVSVAAAVLLTTSVAIYALRSSSDEQVVAPRSSIAVLPFVNLSGDSPNEFLSDGLTDDLIESLGQVPGLRVVARTSAFRLKGKTLSVQEIGHQLRVHTVLKGAVRLSGNSLRITTQLYNAADGHALWSGSFDHNTNDTGLIQKDIVPEVAAVLGSRLNPNEDTKAITQNPLSPKHDAYQAYLKGLYLWNKLSAGDLQMAIDYFKQAIALDPSFARAYAALADSYVVAPQVSTVAQKDIIPQIRAASNKALELDPSLGEAHIDLAICAEYDYDWAAAEREFKKGIELSPDNAVARLWYAKFLAVVGRRSEVLEQRTIAADLDPVSPYALQALGGYFSVEHHYGEAIKQFRSAIALEPNFGLSHQGLGVAYVLEGHYAEGIAEIKLACKLMPSPRREALLGWAYGVSGNHADAQRILEGFLRQAHSDSFPALAIAQVYLGLGDTNQAFAWLNRAADQRDLDMTLQWDSFYEPLRSTGPYRALLKRLRLS